MKNRLRVLAAGSLRRAFMPLLAEFTQQTNIEIDVDFGPAGILRRRIEQGEQVDLFASANALHPQTLQQRGLTNDIRLFAHNRLCLSARNTDEYADKDWLGLLRCHELVLATSTPGSDPCGDYAWQLFDRIEHDYPGLGDRLKQRAKPLVGGENSLVIPPGELAASWLITNGFADMFIGYASYADVIKRQGNIEVLSIPEPYNIQVDYKLAVLSDVGASLADYIDSDGGKDYLKRYGFTVPG